MQTEIDINQKLGFGRILNVSIDIYKNNFIYFLNMALIFFIPVIILTLLMFSNLTTVVNTLKSYKSMDEISQYFQSVTFVNSVPGLIGFLLIAMIFSVLYQCAVVKGAASIINGKPLSIGAVLIYVVRRVILIVVTVFFTGLLCVCGLLFCIIPGLVLFCFTLYVTQAMMEDNRYVFNAIGRSFSIIRKNLFASIAVPVLVYFVYYFFSNIINLAISLPTIIPTIIQGIKTGETGGFGNSYLHLQLVAMAISYLIFILIYPVAYIGMTLKYLNLRNLKEGTDIINDIELDIKDETAGE